MKPNCFITAYFLVALHIGRGIHKHIRGRAMVKRRPRPCKRASSAPNVRVVMPRKRRVEHGLYGFVTLPALDDTALESDLGRRGSGEQEKA